MTDVQEGAAELVLPNQHLNTRHIFKGLRPCVAVCCVVCCSVLQYLALLVRVRMLVKVLRSGNFLAVSDILKHSGTFVVHSVRIYIGLLILPRTCFTLAFFHFQHLLAQRLRVIYTYTCSPRFSINVASSQDDAHIC